MLTNFKTLLYLVLLNGLCVVNNWVYAKTPFAATPIQRPVVNNAFGVGERLMFSVDFGAITAGYASLEVLQVIELAGRRTYRIRAEAKSSKGFDYVYKVRDRIESFVDSIDFYTLRFVKRLREGNYKDDKLVTYDHSTRKAKLLSWGKEDVTTDFDSLTQDVLSALYFVRLFDLKVDSSVYFPVHDIKKSYPLRVEVQRRERVKVPAGEFDCLVVEPKLQSEGIFKRKGRIWVWLTNDEKKMPVKMESELPFGAISANLIEYHLGIPPAKLTLYNDGIPTK
ncbi:MAG: DUF3108 domain-containing protein [bacterium]|nr:DUF3108 domain-containing protein [bacterium]